ncbi:MAG: hypothetical protein R3D67_04730 [Hyphomicrobiaceae bacterium]
MLLRIGRLFLTVTGLAIASAIVVLALEPQPERGHKLGHVGCKHGHGSTWLRNHSLRGKARTESEDDEPEQAARSGLRPFTAFRR